jgi:predicted transcriptional regulator
MTADSLLGFFPEMRLVLQQFSYFLNLTASEPGAYESVLSALIVAHYLHRHDVHAEALPELVLQVRQALSDPSSAVKLRDKSIKPFGCLKPAVPVAASIAPDFIICLEDGRPCKSLKRHLRVHYGMTPETYRIRWGLPDNYPMVAPNFSRRRAEIARLNKLGRYERN